MTVISAQIDLSALGLTLDDWKNSVFSNSQWGEVVRKPVWDAHQRNLLDGWIHGGKASTFSTSGIFDGDTLAEPGIYALVWDPYNTATNPILDKRTFVFGEGCQPVYKRIYANTSALRGVTSNMSDKWRTQKPYVCYELGITNLDPCDVTVFYRPHCVSDPDFKFERNHSQEMETQAHAMYWAYHGHKTSANSRDLPYIFHLEKATALLESKGHNCKWIK